MYRDTKNVYRRLFIVSRPMEKNMFVFFLIVPGMIADTEII